MNRSIKTIEKLALGLIVLSLLSACGLTSRSLKHDPGYAHMAYPSRWEAKSELQLSLGPRIMALVSKAMEEDDDYSGLIKSIKGIQLSVFSAKDNAPLLNRYIRKSARRLAADEWEALIAVRENNGEHMYMMAKIDGDIINGIAIMALDADEAVFINLIGHIEPQAIRPIVAEIYQDMPSLGLEI